jgi:hypothetical protein
MGALETAEAKPRAVAGKRPARSPVKQKFVIPLDLAPVEARLMERLPDGEACSMATGQGSVSMYLRSDRGARRVEHH